MQMWLFSTRQHFLQPVTWLNLSARLERWKHNKLGSHVQRLINATQKIIFIRFWHEDCDFRLPMFVFTSFDWHNESTICKHLSICIQNLHLLTEILLLSICVPNSKINAHKILTGTLTEDYGGLLFCFFHVFFQYLLSQSV